ncbi:MAG: DUF924 family protein [Paenalcaligenes sp.]
MSAIAHDDVLAFWSENKNFWFNKSTEFDQEFHHHCQALHWQAARRELESWIQYEDSGLALLILLDQFPRNCFRQSGHMYATDSLARHYARLLVDRKGDLTLPQELRVFCYLPFTHSENLEDQDLAVRLNERGKTGEGLKFAHHHREIIQRFGRFPHRNEILGRESTPEELAYIAEGGFSG